MAGENKQKASSEFERQQFINFFEELCWLLGSNKDINFKKASNYLREFRNFTVHGAITSGTSSNAYDLIGVLPSLLKDNEIFQSNTQLVQFAKEVLALDIPCLLYTSDAADD